MLWKKNKKERNRIDQFHSVLKREEFKYAEDKWTVRQVFIHLADDERYYAYKAFSYSRQVRCISGSSQGARHYNKDFNATGRTLKDIL